MRSQQAAHRWLVIALLVCVPGAVGAAVNDPGAAFAVQHLLRQVAQFEEQGQWAKALQLYEQLPVHERNRAEVRERYRTCLRRVQQLRRHQDPSYREQILTLSWHDALQIYGEVLGKLQLNYVDREKIELNRLFRQGVEEFRLALGDDSFCAQHLPGIKPEVIRAFQAELEVGRHRRVTRIRDAQDQAQAVAWAAQEKLGLLKTVVIFEFICGACAGLDEYTYYLTPGDFEELNASWEGKLVGVGLEVTTDGQQLVISRVVPGSSAYAKGLKVGDWLTRIGMQATTNLPAETAAALLKGEIDSVVDVEVVTADMRLLQVPLRRQAVPLPSVSEPRFLDDRREIGYLQLIAFQETTLPELDDAILHLQTAGMKVLILDLRGHPGGPFNIAVLVAERFLSSGVIVSTHGQVRDYNKVYQANPANVQTVPLVILVDGETASAAEMVAGALKENQRGKLVGETTFGKGSIQRVDQLRTAPLSGIRMTVATFYTPTGRAYGGAGITPDVVIRTDVSMAIGQDAQLQAAIDLARPLTMSP